MQEKLGRDEASLRSFDHLAAVSERIPLLKTRALFVQARLFWQVPAVRQRVQFADFYKELRSRAKEAQRLELQPFPAKRLLEEIRALQSLYVEDERLDQEVNLEPMRLSLGQFLEQLTQKTGVSLDVAKEIEGEFHTAIDRRALPLRALMYELACRGDTGRWWRRRDDTYLLMAGTRGSGELPRRRS